jgi:hypothetical protein
MARPSKLTPEIARKVCEYVAAGLDYERAAACCGISARSIGRWRTRGMQSRGGKYRDFARALDQAEAQAEARAVLLVGKAAQKDWRAAIWLLERRFAVRWGAKKSVEPTTTDDPETTAAKIRDALRAMKDSVEGPPEDGGVRDETASA